MDEIKQRKSRKNGEETRRRIIEFIESFLAENHYAPDYQEIAEGAKVGSTAVVNYHIKILKANGVVGERPRQRRTIHIIQNRE